MSEYLISSGGAVLACARCNAEWTGTGHVCTDLAAMKRALDAAEADRDYWHAQATMAAPCVDAVRALTLRLIPGGTGCAVDPERVVAAVDGLRAECDRIDRLASRQAGEYMEAAHGLAVDRDAARRAATFAEMERDTLRGLTDAMRADNVRLRGIVAGRTQPPTDAEIAAHERVGGRWRCALVHLRGGHDWMDDDDARAKVRLSAPGTWRWWPLDASGRPCPWPTPALDAAGEGR